MRLVVIALLVAGGMLGGLAFLAAGEENAALMGFAGMLFTFAGAWLLYVRFRRRT